MLKPDHKKLLITFVIIAFAVRLIYTIYIFNNDGYSGFADDWEYIGYANELRLGHFIEFDRDNPKLDSIVLNDVIGPGLPITILPILKIFGDNYFPVFLLNILLQCISVVLVYMVAKYVFNSHAALLASFWMTFYYYQFRYIPRVLKESLLIFLVLALVYTILKSMKIKQYYFLMLPAFLFTYLIHTDERYLTFFPILLITFWIIGSESLKLRLIRMIIFTTMVVIFSAPWFIRNYIKYDRPVILTTRLQDKINPIVGASPVVKPQFKSKLDQALAKYARDGKSKAELKYLETHLPPHLYQGWEKYQVNTLEHWRVARFTPGYVTNGYRFSNKRPLLNNLLKIMIWGIPLFASIIGIVSSLKQKNASALFIILLVVSNGIIHSGLLIAGMQRYRMPIDSLVIILGCYGIIQISTLFLKKLRVT